MCQISLRNNCDIIVMLRRKKVTICFSNNNVSTNKISVCVFCAQFTISVMKDSYNRSRRLHFVNKYFNIKEISVYFNNIKISQGIMSIISIIRDFHTDIMENRYHVQSKTKACSLRHCQRFFLFTGIPSPPKYC